MSPEFCFEAVEEEKGAGDRGTYGYDTPSKASLQIDVSVRVSKGAGQGQPTLVNTFQRLLRGCKLSSAGGKILRRYWQRCFYLTQSSA